MTLAFAPDDHFSPIMVLSQFCVFKFFLINMSMFNYCVLLDQTVNVLFFNKFAM